jgi:hypothetical protein
MLAPQSKTVAHFIAADRRADGGQRRVSVAAEGVSIDRRVAGIAMRLALPIGCFRGVSLSLLENARGSFYRVALDHPDPELRVTLAESASESEIAPEWKAWAGFFGLPRIALAPGQDPLFPDSRLGGTPVIGEVHPRKRGWPLKSRRSAFSGQRAAGLPSRMPVVHRGEREIVCYE